MDRSDGVGVAESVVGGTIADCCASRGELEESA